MVKVRGNSDIKKILQLTKVIKKKNSNRAKVAFSAKLVACKKKSFFVHFRLLPTLNINVNKMFLIYFIEKK